MRIKKLLYGLIFLISMFTAQAASQQGTNVRIVEDTLWVATFIVLSLFSYVFINISKGGNKGLFYGYLVLLLSGISGFLWKGIGLIKRVMITSNPEWFFNIARETFEGLTGLLFAIAFLILFITLTKK